MKIKVNGEEKKIELDQENALLSTALKHMGYRPNTVVVELNNLIINSMKWEKVKLKDGDNLEIVSSLNLKDYEDFNMQNFIF